LEHTVAAVAVVEEEVAAAVMKDAAVVTEEEEEEEVVVEEEEWHPRASIFAPRRAETLGSFFDKEFDEALDQRPARPVHTPEDMVSNVGGVCWVPTVNGCAL
jgi:hypothetical protein